MAYRNKQEPAPSYLNDEQDFVRSASKAQRKAFVEQYEDRFGKSFTERYKGDTGQNLTFMDKLRREPDLLKKYEAARRGVIGDTRKNLGVLRTEGAMERATESSRANQKMVLGIAKDLNGRILEGGLFGVIFGGPKRQQWLASIENEYPQTRGNLLPLIEQGFENAAWDAAKSGNPKKFSNFMKKMGRPLGAQDEARVQQIIAAPATIKDRLEAIVETLFVGAVGYILTGGFSILLGKIRTPIPLHKADLPSKDAITRALHGEGAREQAQAAHNEFWNESEKLRITKGATEKAKRLYGKEAAYVLSAIEEFGAQIDVNSNWLTKGIKKGQARNLQKAQEFRPWDTQKTLASMRFKAGSPEEGRRVSLLEKLAQTQTVRGLAESGSETGRYNKMLSMISGYGSEQAFLDTHVLPSEAIYGGNVKYIRQAIHAYFSGGYAPYRDETGRDIPSYRYQRGDQRIIYSLVHSQYTPGMTKMIDAYKGGSARIKANWETANDRTTGGGKNVVEKSPAYSRKLLKNIDITNPQSVAQVFREAEINNKSIADTYSYNLSKIKGINITPDALVRAIEKGTYGYIEGFNTTRGQKSPGENNFVGEAFIFYIPETSGVYRKCAIKKDCANLIIGERVYGSESYLDNLPATVYFEAPLIVSLSKPQKVQSTQRREGPGTGTPPQEGPNPPITPETPPATSNPGGGGTGASTEVPGTRPPHTHNFAGETPGTEGVIPVATGRAPVRP